MIREALILSEAEREAVKKALECPGPVKCRHCVEVGGGFSGERYACSRCGDTYYLDYEEMR